MLARASPTGSDDAVPQVDLRRVVRDEVDLLLAQQRLEVGLGDVGLDEARGLGEPSRGGPVERSSTTTTRWPSARCRLRHVRADEARAAGDEDVHRILSMIRKAA